MTWERLRASARPSLGDLWPVRPPGPGCCVVCRGPAQPGYRRCYQCGRHRREAPGLLADAVVPVSYAIKGGRYAGALYRYKGDGPEAPAEQAWLRAVMLLFLHDHGPCVERASGGPPDLLAVIPGGQGRPGPHPLLSLLAPFVTVPRLRLSVRPGEPIGRWLSPGRFAVGPGAAGANVLIIDDTWVSGASAQSAAVAVRRAGAARVAVLVLGRHLDPGDPRSAGFAAGLRAGPYDPGDCAVHGQPPGDIAGSRILGFTVSVAD